MSARQGWLWILTICAGLMYVGGCAQSDPPGDAAAESVDSEKRSEPLTASIERPSTEEDEDDDDLDLDDEPAAEPEEGTADWYVREIVKLRLMPYPALETASEDGTPSEEETENEAEMTSAQLEHQAQVRRERNLKVVELAQKAIALTSSKPEKEIVFTVAVHHLLDARLQLALAGDQEDVNALYEIVEVLQQSRPNSEAAAAAGLTLVNFCHANALRYAQSEPKWIQEFARQAQIFANRVAVEQAAQPEEGANAAEKHRMAQLQQDVSRAAQILFAAGQSCDAAGFAEDGKACYLLLKSKFPETMPAQQAAGIVRRLNLKGQPLQLAGPTLDGNFVSIEDFKGKTVLVVFWSSQAKPFVEQLPAITSLLKKAQRYNVMALGVNLDTDESEVDAFLEEHGLAWPQIFFSEPEKRGWSSPVAAYYGINQLPTVWIVDPEGMVAETDLTAENLETKLKGVVVQHHRATTGTGGGGIQQAGGTLKK